MTIPMEELQKYLGKSLDDLEGRFYKAVKKLRTFDTYTRENCGQSAPDYLLLSHCQEGKSIMVLSSEAGISPTTLGNIFDFYGFPRRTLREAVRVRASRHKDQGVEERPANLVAKLYQYDGQYTLPDVDYFMGDEISHNTFGRGRVVGVHNSIGMPWYKIEVMFDDGIRKLIVKHE